MASKRLREAYLSAVLRQEIQFFDITGPGEIATRLDTDTRMTSCRQIADGLTFVQISCIAEFLTKYPWHFHS